MGQFIESMALTGWKGMEGDKMNFGLGTSKELKTQVFFRDDQKFRFIKRPLEHSCLVEKQGDEIIFAWKHFYSNQIPFRGYKRLKPDMITLGFARDIILDPFDKIPKGDTLSKKPTSEQTLKRWIARMAENMRHYYHVRRKKADMTDKVAYVLMGIIAAEVVVWLFRMFTG